MNSKLKLVLYGIGAFAVFIVIVVVLRLISGDVPEDVILFNMFSKNDLLLGLAVAVVVTFSHDQRQRLKK